MTCPRSWLDFRLIAHCRRLPRRRPNSLFGNSERLVPTGEPILCIHPSDEISGTVRSATVAAADFEGADIRIIDTRVIASPLATMVELAVKWANAGLDADTIEKRLRELPPRWRIYFMVPTLEYLARGGRIGGAAALLGSVLQIKPILALQGGRVESYEKERTKKRALARPRSWCWSRSCATKKLTSR